MRRRIEQDRGVASSSVKAGRLPLAEKNGTISSVVVETENGITVVNHWENQDRAPGE